MLGLFSKKSSEDKILQRFIKSTFHITPNNLELYKIALTHSSYLYKQDKRQHSNERLEFLGDAILDSVVAQYLFEIFPRYSEGELTKLKSKVVSRKNLNILALALQIDQHVKHRLKIDTDQTSVLGNALEALIGALFIDKGYNSTKHSVLRVLEGFDIENVLFEQKDYKSLIHEWCQQYKKEVIFSTINQTQVEGRTHYEVVAIIDDEIHGKGKATSKKKAQQIAAREAFKKVKGSRSDNSSADI